jgi:hypothetical protein
MSRQKCIKLCKTREKVFTKENKYYIIDLS